MFALYPQDVGVILTYRCHSGCKHCLYNCGPRWGKEAMSPQTLRQRSLLSQPRLASRAFRDMLRNFDLALKNRFELFFCQMTHRLHLLNPMSFA